MTSDVDTLRDMATSCGQTLHPPAQVEPLSRTPSLRTPGLTMHEGLLKSRADRGRDSAAAMASTSYPGGHGIFREPSEPLNTATIVRCRLERFSNLPRSPRLPKRGSQTCAMLPQTASHTSFSAATPKVALCHCEAAVLRCNEATWACSRVAVYCRCQAVCGRCVDRGGCRLRGPNPGRLFSAVEAGQGMENIEAA